MSFRPFPSPSIWARIARVPALIAALALALALGGLLGCGPRGGQRADAPGAGPANSAANAGAADTDIDTDTDDLALVTDMPEDERGGTLVVLLHGYGSTGDAFRGLAREILAPGMRIALPTAPLSHPGGHGRMWWSFEDADWPKPWSDDPSANAWPPPSKALVRARTAVIERIEALRARYAPETLFLVGFSQGAMLALDLAVTLDPPPDRVAAVSGYLLIDTARRLESEPAGARPRVLVVHGRRDEIVELARAETTVRTLEANGFEVDLLVHDGGHSIPPKAVERLRAFVAE